MDGFLYYEDNIHAVKSVRIVFAIDLLPPSLEIVFSLLLVISACYITSWVTKSTGKKQNTCLLTWHIINLFILTIVIALNAVSYEKAYSSQEDDKNYWKLKFYSTLSALVQLNAEFYVDLFLLWLLYRFMKPQKNLHDGRTEASVLLFAHDGKKAQKILLSSYTEDDEQRKV